MSCSPTRLTEVSGASRSAMTSSRVSLSSRLRRTRRALGASLLVRRYSQPSCTVTGHQPAAQSSNSGVGGAVGLSGSRRWSWLTSSVLRQVLTSRTSPPWLRQAPNPHSGSSGRA